MNPTDKSFLFRPVMAADAQSLLGLVLKSSGGLSSLQPRLAFLQDYIAASEASFSGKMDIDATHKYLLGMFELGSERLIGCAAVKTQIGIKAPFINFDIIGDGLDQELKASSRFKGATEVGSLFLHPEYRRDGLGRYLAKARYLLIAAEPWRFGESVIAELRGMCGAEGSPLYDYLFRDKLEKTFLEADAEYFDRNPDTLGDIVPINAISTLNFPLDVKSALGHPHPSGLGAMRLLQSEGFIFSGTIDLFDGGPIMAVHRDTIRTIMDIHKAAALPLPFAGLSGRSMTLVSQGKVADFRAVLTPAQLSPNGLLIAPDVFNRLHTKPEAALRYWQAREERQPIHDTLVKAHI